MRIVVADHDPVFLTLLQEVLDAPFRQETETLKTLSTLRLNRATRAIPVVVCTTAPRELRGLQDRQAGGLYLLAVLAEVLRTAPPRQRAR